MTDKTEQIFNPIEEAIKKRNDFEQKNFKIRESYVEEKYSDLLVRKSKKEALKSVESKLGACDPDRINDLIKKNNDYLAMAKNSRIFLGLKIFEDKIAFFPRNIILIGATTGEGKTTVSTNIILSTIMQKGKILILTNEENTNDMLNRIVFLLNNWVYTDHNKITEEQRITCEKLYPILLQRIEIVDDFFNGVGGTTTTLEGIKSVCEALKVKADKYKIQYDVIILDYIQNVSGSTDNPSMDQWKVISNMGSYLDQFKNVYDAPIILLSQLKSSQDEDADFKDRIEKSKAIMNIATTAIELRIDRENLRSEFIIKKSRFKNSVGKKIPVGFKKGEFVEYTSEFANTVRINNDRRNHSKLISSPINNGGNTNVENN
jgi:replicative DNA helicase